MAVAFAVIRLGQAALVACQVVGPSHGASGLPNCGHQPKRLTGIKGIRQIRLVPDRLNNREILAYLNRK